MNKPHVLQIGPYPQRDEELLNQHFELHRLFEIEDRDVFLESHGADIRAIATRGDLGASGELIQSLPSLEIIAINGVGFDSVDLGAAKSRGIAVSNTPDVLTEDVADLAVGMMLAQSRRMVAAEHWVRSGDWKNQGDFPLTTRLHGKRAGILGLGRIGTAVASRLAAFKMDICYSSTSAKKTPDSWKYIKDPVELAVNSDFLVMTLAANDQTRHIVNKPVLDALGPQGVLINVSRAANVDETALLEALEKAEIAGAALDVFDGEPDINPRFLTFDNVLLQPHHSSATVETRKAMGDLMRENLLAYFAGKDLLTPVL